MPTNKHKRKASAHAKSGTVKKIKASGLITTHPKFFALIGIFFIVLGIYLLAFESQNNAMFGFAMLALITGVMTTIYAKFTNVKKTAQHK